MTPSELIRLQILASIPARVEAPARWLERRAPRENAEPHRITEADMMHGRDWAGEDLAGWYLGEKLHGCRTYWDGTRLWTRDGNVVRIPTAWAASLPSTRLDCELWAGRRGYLDARLATQYGRFTPACRLMVFDVDDGGDFLERQAIAREAVAGLNFAEAVRHVPCASTAAALAMLREVKAIGGEGLMARHPENYYEAGRTREILKLKKEPIQC